MYIYRFCAITLCKIFPSFFFFLSTQASLIRFFLQSKRFRFNSTSDSLEMEHRRESRILPSRVFFVERAESRLIESTEVNSSRSPRRGDRFPALISLRDAFSFKHLFYFSHYETPHLRRGTREKSRSIRDPLDPPRRKNIQIARSLPRMRNDRIMKAHFVFDRSTWRSGSREGGRGGHGERMSIHQFN